MEIEICAAATAPGKSELKPDLVISTQPPLNFCESQCSENSNLVGRLKVARVILLRLRLPLLTGIPDNPGYLG